MMARLRGQRKALREAAVPTVHLNDEGCKPLVVCIIALLLCARLPWFRLRWNICLRCVTLAEHGEQKKKHIVEDNIFHAGCLRRYRTLRRSRCLKWLLAWRLVVSIALHKRSFYRSLCPG